MHFHKPCASTPQLLIATHLGLHLNQEAMWDGAQFGLALLASAQNHTGMQLTLSAFAAWFATLGFQFISRSLNHRLVGEKRFGSLPDLVR